MYAGGFLHGLASGGTIQDAGSFASLVAARIITQTGAQLSRESADSIRKEYSYADNNSPNESAAV
jgi:sugar/nucleoside kinase (ribokinase family)